MIRLAIPVILTYLGLMTMTMVDLIFVGRIGPVAIGAVGIGSSVFAWFMIFGIGLLSGLEFLISRSVGEEDSEAGRRYFIHGIWVSFLLGIPLTLALYGFASHLDWLGINPDVARAAESYLKVLSWSLIPVYLFTASRLFLQAHGFPKAAMIILILANFINLAANFALVEGHWGFPPLGSTGSAWATLISRIWMLAALTGTLAMHVHEHFSRKTFALELSRLRELLRLGIPTALQMTFEVGVFALTTTLAAKLQPEDLAAHQIVLNIASLTFMVPLGISSSAAVLVGREVGRGDYAAAGRWGWKGLAFGVGFMAFSALMLLCFSGTLIGIYSKDAGVLRVAGQILLIAALFQLSDGAQVVATGILRGIGSTRYPMVANLLGHWAIGLPIGILLCYGLHWGLQGLWIGLSFGLTSVALVLVLRWRQEIHQRKYAG